MHLLTHTLFHSFLDTIKIIPFIFLMYLLIEYFEHRNNTHLSHKLMKTKFSGPVFGGLFGSIPQCGFSVIASDLYSKRAITLGTLIAIFIATSDEAIPIILSTPQKSHIVLELILIKIIIAILFGFIIDLIYKNKKEIICDSSNEHHHFHGNCESCEDGIIKSALIHTVKIFLFVFIASFIFSLAIEITGEEKLTSLFLKESFIQPFIASLIGLIPNCAASVILTQGFLNGIISFGSLVAGLCSGAGVGLLVLFKRNKNLKENITILIILILIGTLSGFTIQYII